jgi:hypothetical protein
MITEYNAKLDLWEVTNGVLTVRAKSKEATVEAFKERLARYNEITEYPPGRLYPSWDQS